MAALPEGWEWDYDGTRWLYRYKPSGLVQYHFPQPGDEFPEFVDTLTDPVLAPEERLESRQQAKRRSTTETTPISKSTAGSTGPSSAPVLESDEGDGAAGGGWFQPDSFMYLGPGAYTDISPEQDEDGYGSAPESSAKRKTTGKNGEIGVAEQRSTTQSQVEHVQPNATTMITPHADHVQPVMEASTASNLPPKEPVITAPTQQVFSPVGFMAELQSDATALCVDETNPAPVELPSFDTSHSHISHQDVDYSVFHVEPAELPTQYGSVEEQAVGPEYQGQVYGWQQHQQQQAIQQAAHAYGQYQQPQQYYNHQLPQHLQQVQFNPMQQPYYQHPMHHQHQLQPGALQHSQPYPAAGYIQPRAPLWGQQYMSHQPNMALATSAQYHAIANIYGQHGQGAIVQHPHLGNSPSVVNYDAGLPQQYQLPGQQAQPSSLPKDGPSVAQIQHVNFGQYNAPAHSEHTQDSDEPRIGIMRTGTLPPNMPSLPFMGESRHQVPAAKPKSSGVQPHDSPGMAFSGSQNISETPDVDKTQHQAVNQVYSSLAHTETVEGSDFHPQSSHAPAPLKLGAKSSSRESSPAQSGVFQPPPDANTQQAQYGKYSAHEPAPIMSASFASAGYANPTDHSSSIAVPSGSDIAPTTNSLKQQQTHSIMDSMPSEPVSKSPEQQNAGVYHVPTSSTTNRPSFPAVSQEGSNMSEVSSVSSASGVGLPLDSPSLSTPSQTPSPVVNTPPSRQASLSGHHTYGDIAPPRTTPRPGPTRGFSEPRIHDVADESHSSPASPASSHHQAPSVPRKAAAVRRNNSQSQSSHLANVTPAPTASPVASASTIASHPLAGEVADLPGGQRPDLILQRDEIPKLASAPLPRPYLQEQSPGLMAQQQTVPFVAGVGSAVLPTSQQHEQARAGQGETVRAEISALSSGMGSHGGGRYATTGPLPVTSSHGNQHDKFSSLSQPKQLQQMNLPHRQHENEPVSRAPPTQFGASSPQVTPRPAEQPPWQRSYSQSQRFTPSPGNMSQQAQHISGPPSVKAGLPSQGAQGQSPVQLSENTNAPQQVLHAISHGITMPSPDPASQGQNTNASPPRPPKHAIASGNHNRMSAMPSSLQTSQVQSTSIAPQSSAHIVGLPPATVAPRQAGTQRQLASTLSSSQPQAGLSGQAPMPLQTKAPASQPQTAEENPIPQRPSAFEPSGISAPASPPPQLNTLYRAGPVGHQQQAANQSPTTPTNTRGRTSSQPKPLTVQTNKPPLPASPTPPDSGQPSGERLSSEAVKERLAKLWGKSGAVRKSTPSADGAANVESLIISTPAGVQIQIDDHDKIQENNAAAGKTHDAPTGQTPSLFQLMHGDWQQSQQRQQSQQQQAEQTPMRARPGPLQLHPNQGLSGPAVSSPPLGQLAQPNKQEKPSDIVLAPTSTQPKFDATRTAAQATDNRSMAVKSISDVKITAPATGTNSTVGTDSATEVSSLTEDELDKDGVSVDASGRGHGWGSSYETSAYDGEGWGEEDDY